MNLSVPSCYISQASRPLPQQGGSDGLKGSRLEKEAHSRQLFFPIKFLAATNLEPWLSQETEGSPGHSLISDKKSLQSKGHNEEPDNS